MVFTTLDKKFLKHYAAIGPMVRFAISSGEDTYEIIPEDMKLYLKMLFADKEEHAAEAISRLETFLPSKAQKAQQALTQALAAAEASTPIETLPVAAPVAGLQAAIEAHIQQEVDLDADGAQDALVLYSIEGQGGGNSAFQTLAIFHSEAGGYALHASTVVDGGATGVKLLAPQTIAVSSLTLGPDDPMCCPSVESLQKFSWGGQQLVEIR